MRFIKRLKNWFFSVLDNYWAEETERLYDSLLSEFKKSVKSKRMIAREKYLKNQLKLR